MTGNKAIVNNDITVAGKEAQEAYTSIRLLEPLISREVKQVVSELGNQMIGLEYAAKTGTSVADKLARAKENAAKDNTTFYPTDSLRGMKDLIRYTEVCPHDDIITTTNKTITAMKEHNYLLSGIKNYYKKPFKSTGYMGIHLNFISPYGQEIELQIHSKESFHAKQEGHVLYERIRIISSPTPEKECLIQEIRKIHGSVPKCADYQTIDNYTMPQKTKDFLMDERRRETKVNCEEIPTQNSKTTTYYIEYKNNQIIDGFEHIFSDGSAWSHRHFVNEQAAELIALTADGSIAAEKNIPYKHLEPSRIIEHAQKQEIAHKQWMETNLPYREGNEPDVEERGNKIHPVSLDLDK